MLEESVALEKALQAWIGDRERVARDDSHFSHRGMPQAGAEHAAAGGAAGPEKQQFQRYRSCRILM